MKSKTPRSIEADLRDVITACVKAYIKAGGKWKHLTEMTGVSSNSLKRLVDNETVHPRFHTIEAVLNGFGKELAMMQVADSPVRGDKRSRGEAARSSKRASHQKQLPLGDYRRPETTAH